MNALLLIARCVLAAVFLVAAGGKLFDLAGSRRALEGFGVPGRLARLGGSALPLAELIVAALLVGRPTAVIGAGGALLLLAVFAGGVGYAMSQGRAPDCHCFGQIHSEPAGRSTLARNVVFAAPAILILAGGTGPSLTGGIGSLNGTQGALVAVSVLAAVLAVAAAQFREQARSLKVDLGRALAAKAPPGLPRGTPAPRFGLTPIRGTVSSLDDLVTAGRSTVLVFVSTHCGPCLQMLPALAGWQDTLAGSLTIPAIFSGERQEVERLAQEHELGYALAQDSDETFTAYGLRATPSAVLLDGEGNVGSAPAEGVPAIEALIRAAVARAEPGRLVIHSG